MATWIGPFPILASRRRRQCRSHHRAGLPSCACCTNPVHGISALPYLRHRESDRECGLGWHSEMFVKMPFSSPRGESLPNTREIDRDSQPYLLSSSNPNIKTKTVAIPRDGPEVSLES